MKSGDNEIAEKKFHYYKYPIATGNVGINKTIISNSSSYDKNRKKLMLSFFIRYEDHRGIRPLCIKLPEIDECLSSFKQNKNMSFENNENILLETSNDIWDKFSNIIIKF